jgi:pilus assembly protein CpaF
VQEIVGVPGRVENDVIEVEQIYTAVDGRLVRAAGLPPRQERFERAGYDLQLLLSGQPGAAGQPWMNGVALAAG